jgi:hypothetical protein
MKEKFINFGIVLLVFLLSVGLALAVISTHITVTGSATVITITTVPTTTTTTTESTTTESTTTESTTTIVSETTTISETTTVPSTTTLATTTVVETTTIAETTTIPEITTTLSTTTIPSLDHVVFSEVFYDTPGTESKEEWIELYNPTSNSIDLSGLKISDNSNNYTIPNGAIISNSDFLIIARNETGFYNLYGFLPDISGLTLSLNDNGDVLRLKNGGEEIDMVAWENYVLEWNSIANKNESIQRNPPYQDTDTVNDWISHASPNPGV